MNEPFLTRLLQRAESILIALGIVVPLGISLTTLIAMRAADARFFDEDSRPFMTPISAMLIFLLGSAFGLVYFCPDKKSTVEARAHPTAALQASAVLSVFVLLYAAFSYIRMLFFPNEHAAWELPFATFFLRQAGAKHAVMAASTAGVLAVSSLAVLSLCVRHSERLKRRRPAALLALACTIACGASAISSVTGIPLFFASGDSPMFRLTATTLAMLNFALSLAAGLKQQVDSLFFGDGDTEILLSRIELRRRHWILTALVTILCLIAALGTFFLRSEIRQSRAELEAKLSSIAGLKSTQVADWRRERISDAKALFHAPLFKAENNLMVRTVTDSQTAIYLNNIRETYDYECITLFDPALKPILSSPANWPASNTVPAELLRTALARKNIAGGDLTRDPKGMIYADIATPVFAADGETVGGVILLRVDASRYLFPKLADWPFQSRSGETVLVKQDGNDVLFLSPLRHRTDAPMTLRVSLNQSNLPAAQFILNKVSGIIAGRDYRDVPVLVVSRTVPGTSWSLLAKMDESEAFEVAREQAHLLSTGAFLIMILAIMLAVVLARHRQQMLLRKQLLQERLRAEADERLALLLRHANDGVILLNAQYSVVETNVRAEAIYGYAPGEMLGLSLTDLLTKDDGVTLDACIAASDRPEGHIFQVLNLRKDGSAFPVEFSSRRIDIGGHVYLFAIVRDITERRAYEAQLKRSNRMYAALSAANEAIIHTPNRAELNRKVCRVLVEFGGFKIAWIGAPNSSRRLSPVAVHGDSTGYVAAIYAEVSEAQAAAGPALSAFRTGLPIVVNDFLTDPATAPWRENARKAGIRSKMAIPLSKSGTVVGLLSIYADENDFFGDREIALLTEVAGDLSFAYEVIEREDRRKITEAALAASEYRQRFLLSATPVIIYTCRPFDFQATFISENVKTVLGYDPADVIGSATFWPDNIHPDDKAAAVSAFASLVEKGSVHFEYRFRDASGNYRWMQDQLRVVIGSNGDPLELVGCWFDVTQRKQAEENLQFQKEMSTELVRQAVDSIALIDVKTQRFVEFNDAAHLDLGYTREEFALLTLEDIVDRNQPAENQPASRNIEILEKGSASFESRHVTRTGAIRVAHIRARALTLRGNSYIAAVWTDITDRLRTESEMRKLSSVIEQAPVSIVITNLNGTIEYVNPHFSQLNGYTLQEALGKNPSILKSGKTSIETYRQMWKSLHEGKVWRGEMCNKKKNGEEYIELAVIAPVVGADNRITHYVAIKEDITERKKAEAALAGERNLLAYRVAERTSELSRLNAELGQAVRAKDEFLANMSHELRTPLNAILAMSESLLEQTRGPLNERQQMSLRNIESSGRHLLSLINDILDLSKVEAGRMELHIEKISLSDVCESCLVFVKEIAGKKNIRLGFKLNDSKAHVEADPKRLKQILVNLLSNSVKFTDSGGTVGLAAEVDPVAGVIRFTVTDTGIGITSANMSRLFQPFQQLDSSLNRLHEGTGLGLALVRKLTELHRGSVTVDSEPGKGSHFIVTIPYSVPEAQMASPEEMKSRHAPGNAAIEPQISGDAPKEWILLVEDNEMNIQITEEYLQSNGYLVAVARNGIEALQRAEEIHPAVILMDIQMPVMDGLEATRRLRAIPGFAHTPIIALTALAMPGDRERCILAGANDYLTKPVSLKGLVEKITHTLKASDVKETKS